MIGLLLLSSALAQDAQYTQLEAGEQAPFAGYLFNETATAELIVEKQFAMTECDLRTEFEISRIRAEYDLQIRLADIQATAEQEKLNFLLTETQNELDTYIENAARRPNTHLWFAGGMAAGIVTSVAIFYAATEISK